ncbi:hypothetical protein N9K63_00175 [Candidatus Pelagibacter bacterium]|jgi:hypothetical protein|nr:hypothetical protein [Candidatus Pelagibacter bacterium]
MKKILSILVLSLLLSGNAYADSYLSDEKCASLAGEANTNYSARIIINKCRWQRDVMFSFNYDEDLKCAIKSGKAKTEYAAQKIYRDCW